jgi:hypothetical protein
MMILRLAIALGFAAALIPISLLIGLSPGRSILISGIVAILFLAFAAGMSRLVR